MVRRTKEDALSTRRNLLDAAEELFQEQGVSRTSLQEIAKRAGATRGAIYWHFRDKADLFNAMMERVTLPMEECFERHGSTLPRIDTDKDAIDNIWQAITDCLEQISRDPQIRRILEVATLKVEYVDELHAVRERHINVRNAFLARFEQSICTAAQQQKLKLPIPVNVAANGFHALIDGLIQNWLLDQTAFDLLNTGQAMMRIYLNGLGFTTDPQTKTNPHHAMGVQ